MTPEMYMLPGFLAGIVGGGFIMLLFTKDVYKHRGILAERERFEIVDLPGVKAAEYERGRTAGLAEGKQFHVLNEREDMGYQRGVSEGAEKHKQELIDAGEFGYKRGAQEKEAELKGNDLILPETRDKKTGRFAPLKKAAKAK